MANTAATDTDARPHVVVFGFDAAEAAQIRRIRSYMDCGFSVQGFTMRRDNMNADFVPFWPNVSLGIVPNENMRRRIAALIRAVPVVARHREKLADADLVVARNLDMLALAVVARLLAPGTKPPVIYECLDIHGAMTDGGAKGRLFRWLERRLLAHTRSLIISSPAFLANYFEPVQGWTGTTKLLENKMWFDDGALSRPNPDPVPGSENDTDAIRLGWVGTLRCPRSLEILMEAARQMGPKLEVRMHGVVHRHALPDFDQIVADHSNIAYLGPYEYPQGLAAVYADCDLVWSQDLWQWGTNSTWLLPNRIYEASFFGCPSLAVDGTETGRRVGDGLGWTIPEPTADALVSCIEMLSKLDLQTARRQLLEQPESRFRQTNDEILAAMTV